MEGVTATTCSMGQIGTFATIHTEDMNLPSANYHAIGATKYWFSQPAKYFDTIEEIQRSAHVNPTCTNVAGHKVFLIDPKMLAQQHNIPTYSVAQEPGEFVITAPAAHHMVYNAGPNNNMAINFYMELWNEKYALTKLPCFDPCTRITKDKVWTASSQIENVDNYHRWGMNRFFDFIRRLNTARITAEMNSSESLCSLEDIQDKTIDPPSHPWQPAARMHNQRVPLSQ